MCATELHDVDRTVLDTGPIPHSTKKMLEGHVSTVETRLRSTNSMVAETVLEHPGSIAIKQKSSCTIFLQCGSTVEVGVQATKKIAVLSSTTILL